MKKVTKDNDLPNKRRDRKILVCINCRIKKNKCDRCMPCSSCIQLGLVDSCRYQTPTGVPERDYSNGTPENSKKFKQIVAVSYMFPYIPLTTIDPGTKMRWNFFGYQKDSPSCKYFLLDRLNFGLSRYEITGFTDRIIQDLKSSHPLKYYDVDRGVINVSDTKRAISSYGGHLGLVYDETLFHQEQLHILRQVKIILPSQISLINMVQQYFSELGSMVPVLDEIDFMNVFYRIFNLVDPKEEEVKLISVTHKQDYAIIAITLFIIRLVYIYELALNNYNAELAELVEPISLDAIEVARKCLKIHGFTGQPTVPFLQALVIYLTYQKYAPERGEGCVGDQVLRGTIIEVAYSLGFHRDPTTFDLENFSPKQEHLRRKIWYFILCENHFHSVTYLTVLRPTSFDYDCKWPSFNIGVSNFKNIMIEKDIVDCFAYAFPVIENVEKTLNLVQTVKPKDENTINAFNLELDLYMTATLPSVKAIKEEDLSYLFKIYKIHIYIYAKCFLTVNLYYSLIKSEEVGDIEAANFYFKESLNSLYNHLGDIDMGILSGEFARMRLLTTSLVSLVFNLTVSLSLTTAVRIRSTIMANPNDPVLCAKLNELLQPIQRFALCRLKFLIELSRTHMSSWKYVKYYLFDIDFSLGGTGIYTAQPEQVLDTKLNLSVNDIDSIISTCKDSWDKNGIYDNTNDVDQYNLKALLKTKPGIYEDDMKKFIHADQLWGAKIIMNLFNENQVPKDPSDDTVNDETFDFKQEEYASFPGERGIYGLLTQ